ncbi:tetratricopeptide repeat protein [Desulfovibrio sp. OttesenSCG-928-G15]|nr:tetratricopeptide repeat protein [Desulfovibrio sp. OttesenSCG-928-G15]
MVQLSALRQQFSEVGDALLQTDGYALWMFWRGDANPIALQTLEDYGGMKLAEDGDQALFFFFTADVLIAAARLAVWARFNPLGMGLEVFPCRVAIGRGAEKSIIIDEAFWKQSLTAPSDLRIWSHISMAKTVEMIPGLGVHKTQDDAEGPDSASWVRVEVDSRLPYQSPLSWYAILRPVGNTHDKAFHIGWREYYGNLEATLQRNKFRSSMHDIFLMFPLDSLRQVKTWCMEYFTLIARLKSENPDAYWPSVMAVVDRKGLTLNEELPFKVGVEWEHLVPDYPHMVLRNALLLGDGIAAHEVRFATFNRKPDDWVSISLKGEDDDFASGEKLPQLSPVNLIFGSHPGCFYCGQRSHETVACPTRVMDSGGANVWAEIAQMDLPTMRAAVTKLDERLGNIDDETERTSDILALVKADSPEAVIARAFYDITWPVQLRAVSFFWRARNKDLQKAAKTLVTVDDNPSWTVLSSFATTANHDLDEALKNVAAKNSRDYRYLSLRGFWAMEKGDYEKAIVFWQDAERASPHPVVQAWHLFLQGRSLEMSGNYSAAAANYDQVARACPGWFDAQYRRAVCLVKNGFSGEGIDLIKSLVDRSGHFFNRALLDPELERGYIQVLAALGFLWTGMEEKASEETANLMRLRGDLGTWFVPDNAFAGEIAERIDRLLERSSAKNYVSFQRVVAGRVKIDRDIQTHVLAEAKHYKNVFKAQSKRLKTVHEESAWFPFPRTLVEFNKSYNEAVANSNWALMANFHSPESFRKGQMLIEQETERIDGLESKLKFLRFVRDSTLFVLTMGETFLWLEIIGIVLVFLAVPAVSFYGDRFGLNFALGTSEADRGQMQKALALLVTIFAAAIACIRTILRFEKIRDTLLTKAKEGQIKSGKRR